MARVTLAERWIALLGFAERRLPALTRFKPVEALPIILHRRRIYVLPTRFGLIYSMMLLVMLLGALNYNNNPALLLTCLLGAASYQSVFVAFRSLNRLTLLAVRAQSCSAGESLQLKLVFNAYGTMRESLHLSMENATIAQTTADHVEKKRKFVTPSRRARLRKNERIFGTVANQAIVEVSVPALRRGLQPIGRIQLWTEFPFGLFQVWSWLHPDVTALIFPRPETSAPPLPGDGGATGARVPRRGGDDLSMLRDYHPSDARRTIAWKASARHDQLMVKEFERQTGNEVTLDFQMLGGIAYELRIARLAAWVDRAAAMHVNFVLQLPTVRLGPATGAQHRLDCLRALALLPVLT